MRALLVVNPKATATTARARDVLAHALASETKLDVVHTNARGHAMELARQAAVDGLDLVVALGGDGTVNEVVNGLLTNGPGPGIPALAVVPGGSTNVFARALGLRDTIVAIALPYMASAFGIFLLRQTFKTVPKELDEAARVEGCTPLQVLWKVYVPLARPVYLAYALVSVSFHWNNFLWPLIITNSVESRPLTVGLQVFSATDQGIDWSIITAATLLTSAPLLVAFLLFQKQFVLSFMRAGIK
jgi:hypothetical protein